MQAAASYTEGNQNTRGKSEEIFSNYISGAESLVELPVSHAS